MKSDVYEPRYYQSITNHDKRETRVFNTKKELLEFIQYNRDELFKGDIFYTLEPYEKYCYDGKTIHEMVDVTRKIPVSQLPSYMDDTDNEYETNFFNNDNIYEDTENIQNKNKNKGVFILIFILIIIMNVAILITIFGNYNRDKQLLQEIERLEQKIEYLEDENSREQNVLEFM